jgi:hypothetical protein
VDEVSEARYWKERYRAGEAGWDLGGPCPVFVELLASPLAPARGRVAFPGCGMGHDVRLFLEHGYDAVGFDFAVRPEGVPVVEMDVFDLGRRYPGAFDAVVEYTCYCAIDPRRRPEYAAALFDALRRGGLLVALLFPVERREEGPPFGVEEGEITAVLGAGVDLLHLGTPRSSVEARRGRERLAIFRKP